MKYLNILLMVLMTISGWRYSTLKKDYHFEDVSPITIITLVVTSDTLGFEVGNLFTTNPEICTFISCLAVILVHIFWLIISIIREVWEVIENYM